MKKNILSAVVLGMVFLNSAQAASFDSSTIVTASVLRSIVSNSTINFGSGAQVTSGTNSISGNVAKGFMGVMAIAQNNGTGSSLQQIVTVRTGSITIPVSH